MSLRMKNFNIYWISWNYWKIRFLVGVHEKPIYCGGGGCLKRGAWTVCRFSRSLAKNRGVNTPMRTMLMSVFYFISWLLIFGRVPPTSLHRLYFPAPDVTSRMVQGFILTPGVLVRVLKGDVWKILCEIDLVLWVVAHIFQMKMGTYTSLFKYVWPFSEHEALKS